jgi:endogenous inhibitor of DNA gyrase (YacG/DUF329 family)
MPDEFCPVCHKPAQPKYRPFCCARCADVDLGRWITDQYVVAGADGEADSDVDGTPRQGLDMSPAAGA